MRLRNFLQLLFGIFTFIPGVYNFRKIYTGSGGTFSSKYCYAVWFRHLVKIYEKTGKIKFKTVAEIGPGDSIGVGLMSLILGSEKYYAFDSVNFANKKRNLVIFKELVEMIKNKQRIPSEKIFPKVNPFLKNYNFPSKIYSNSFLKKCLNKKRLNKIKYSIMHPNSKNSLIFYKNNWKEFNNLKIKNTIDLIISQATLEHVDDLETTYKSMKYWIKKNGIMSHSIDFKSHGYSSRWDGHWEFSNLYWKLLRGKRPYLINRAPFSFHLKELKKNKFFLIGNQNILLKSSVKKINAPYFFDNNDLRISCTYVMLKQSRNS